MTVHRATVRHNPTITLSEKVVKISEGDFFLFADCRKEKVISVSGNKIETGLYLHKYFGLSLDYDGTNIRLTTYKIDHLSQELSSCGSRTLRPSHKDYTSFRKKLGRMPPIREGY
jgi:hypothetical protein